MVAVKVVLVPEGHVMTVAFAIGLSIQELKRHLALELRVPAEVLQISLNGTNVSLQTLIEKTECYVSVLFQWVSVTPPRL